MNTRTLDSVRPTDPTEVPTIPEESPEKISAYYSLVFPNFTYYLQTLSVTIGRRCIPPTASSSESLQVDVDLGPLKSVSRLHAKIEYEEEEERFVLVVIGRNGAWVDGVWSGSGSRVSLGERSQIQIASRTFHFNLPPPPAPEDSPSPSSQSSHRPRSPSVDITSISPPSSMPSHTPPPGNLPYLPLRPPQHSQKPNIVRNPNSNAKKRKKSNPAPLPIPKPEDMPPRPPLTYAQLCYRAIKATGGKATLQEINQWIIESFDWYKYNDAGWQSSVRHNLSSNPAFKKMERCSDAKRKGFFWAVDDKFESTFEEQEARAQAGKLQDNEVGKDGKWTKKKDRRHGSILEPPLKRSVKSDPKGGPLPPPLTSTPLAPKPPTTPHNPTQTQAPIASGSTSTAPTGQSNGDTSSSSIPTLPPSLFIPIVVGPIPASHPSSLVSTDSTKTNPLASTAIVLHESTLILNPDVFSHLTPEQVKELEALGAQKALEILQGYIARFLKEQRLKKRDAGRGRGRGRGAPKRGRGGAATPHANTSADNVQVNPGPFTTTPLPRRDVKPPLDGDASHKSAEETHSSVNAASPTPVNAEPPVPGTSIIDNPVEPIIVVDDSDSSEAPVAKRRKLDALAIPPAI